LSALAIVWNNIGHTSLYECFQFNTMEISAIEKWILGMMPACRQIGSIDSPSKNHLFNAPLNRMAQTSASTPEYC